jgi:sulfofructose kinase
MGAAIQAAQWAREAGIPTVLDMESLRPRGEELLRLAEFAILPEHFVHEHTGREDLAGAAEEMRRRIGGTLVVTQGDRGCTAFHGDQVIRQPAFRIEKVIDTTGAGDVFPGAFAYGLALGYDLEENLRFSAAVAALKCRALGGRAGIPTYDEAKALIARGPEPASQ